MEINRFDVLDWAPTATDPATEVDESVAVAAQITAAEELGEGEEELGQGPRTATILFELLVRFEGTGEAPEGVDVEIVHSKPSALEQGRYQEWLVTHEMQQGEERLEPFELEISDYEEGDGFSVEISRSSHRRQVTKRPNRTPGRE